MYLIKDILQFVLCQSTALNVFHCTQLFGHPLTILLHDWRHLLLCKLLPDRSLIPKIGLCANNQTWYSRTMMVYFGEPFFADVFEGCRGGDGEANQEHVCLRVGEGAQTVIVFLTCCIEQA